MNKKKGIRYLLSTDDGGEIFRIYGTEGSNVYLIYRNNELLIIDPGFIEDIHHIKNEIDFQFKNEVHIKGIFLTHYHKDHCGGAQRLSEILNCEIYISDIDNEVFLHREKYISLPRKINEGTRKFLENSSLFERCFSTDDSWYPVVNKTVKNDEEIMGFRTLIMPGHTDGTCCLYNEKNGILFSSDYLVYPRGIFPGFFKKFVRTVNMDMEESLNSTKKLLKLKFNTLLPSHGEHLLNNGKITVSGSQLYSDLI